MLALLCACVRVRVSECGVVWVGGGLLLQADSLSNFKQSDAEFWRAAGSLHDPHAATHSSISISYMLRP